MKKCPYCEEEILDEAIKCRHCGKWLTIKSRKTKAKIIIAQCQRFFTDIIIILVMLPIIDPSPSSGDKWYHPTSLLGLVSLSIYLFAILFNKRKIAGASLCLCLTYLFLYDMRGVPLLPSTPDGLAFLIGSMGRFVIEGILLMQGYLGLVTLEKEKNKEAICT